jgi:hypothetical protein
VNLFATSVSFIFLEIFKFGSDIPTLGFVYPGGEKKWARV